MTIARSLKEDCHLLCNCQELLLAGASATLGVTLKDPLERLLSFVARGTMRCAYESSDLIMKLSEHCQSAEVQISGWLPTVAARVFWQEAVDVHLHAPDGSVQTHRVMESPAV